jgi:hypothetical protein
MMKKEDFEPIEASFIGADELNFYFLLSSKNVGA